MANLILLLIGSVNLTLLALLSPLAFTSVRQRARRLLGSRQYVFVVAGALFWVLATSIIGGIYLMIFR